MRRKTTVLYLALALIGAVGVSLVGETTLGLTLHVAGMKPYLGQRLEIRLTDAESGLDVERRVISAVPSESFDVVFGGALSGRPYRLVLASDMNGNGRYDPPPMDHVWHLDIPASDAPIEVSFLPQGDANAIGGSDSPAIATVRVDGIVGPSEYTNATIDPSTGIEIRWTNDAERLYVALISPGTGWVAVGFDPETAMQGADYILAAVDDGQTIIEDHYGTSRFAHRLDESQDVLYAAGTEENSQTTVEFVISLLSADSWDNPLQPGETYTILLALHRTSDSLVAKHTGRSQLVITLDP